MTDDLYRVERAGDLWTIQPPEDPQRVRPMWLTLDAAREKCAALNRDHKIGEALKRRLPPDKFVVYRTMMGGGIWAWAIDFMHFDTVDGPRLLLTEDVHYVLGIYDTRQEVPGGPEPIVQTSSFRVEHETWDEARRRNPNATERELPADPDQLAEWVADRARFILNLAIAEAIDIHEGEAQ